MFKKHLKNLVTTGFEPAKLSQQILSLSPLTAWVSYLYLSNTRYR